MPKHIGFCLTQAYGHIIPTVGMAVELMRLGHRVSYSVTQPFSTAVQKIGARPVLIKPVEVRRALCPQAKRDDGSYELGSTFAEESAKLLEAGFADEFDALITAFRKDPPDLIIHDSSPGSVIRKVSAELRIRTVRHMPSMILESFLSDFREDTLVIVSVPRFFNPPTTRLDSRFQFVGFVPGGRKNFFSPWKPVESSSYLILAAPTTGFLPPIEFCRSIIEAFSSDAASVVLSVPGEMDPESQITPATLQHMPANMMLNQTASNLEILERSNLFIGQGGQGSTLEAMYSGVPMIIIPPSRFHASVAKRIVELGIGMEIPISNMNGSTVRAAAESLKSDAAIRERAKDIAQSMRADGGATAVHAITEFMDSLHP